MEDREEGSVVRSKEFYIRGEVRGEALTHKCISAHFLVRAGSMHMFLCVLTCVCVCVCVCLRERERNFGGLGWGDIEMDRDDILATFSKIVHLTGL